MTYRSAVVGCGRIGSEMGGDVALPGIYSHAHAYTSSASTNLVAICDQDSDKLTKCGDRWGVTGRYLEIKRMLSKEQPEIVSICTPDNTHFELLTETLQAPGVRAVLSEKPIALKPTEAQFVVQLAEDQGVLLAVNYSRRFAASHRNLKNFLNNGGIGQIQAIAGFYNKGVLHNGSHWFDLARFLVGNPIRVSGFNSKKDDSQDPTIDVVLEFENGLHAHLQGCDEQYFGLFEMDILGTEGRIRLTDYGQVFDSYSVSDSRYYTNYKSLTPSPLLHGGLDDAMLSAVENVADCLLHGGRPYCSGIDGSIALRISSSAVESARSGQPIYLDLEQDD